MNYQALLTISPNAGATTPWSFEASLLPHPLNFMVCDVFDSVQPSGHYVSCPNVQIPGATHADRYVAFRELFQRWRLAYMSVTAYQDGPDLANQGTICVSQPPVQPLTGYAQMRDHGFAGGLTTGYTDEDYPRFETSQSMPNAYIAKSRDGAYVPLKLTKTCQDWKSEADSVYLTHFKIVRDSTYEWYTLPFGNPGEVWPHVDLVPRYHYGGEDIDAGILTSPMLSGNFAHISGRNLSNSTSFTFYIRCGIEGQVSPRSSLAPQLKLAPPQDTLALDTYFSISRELKDGYPAAYNDLGKLWDVISGVARRIIPLIPVTGPISAAAKGLASTGVVVGDSIRQRKRNRKRKQSQPLSSGQSKMRTNGKASMK